MRGLDTEVNGHGGLDAIRAGERPAVAKTRDRRREYELNSSAKVGETKQDGGRHQRDTRRQRPSWAIARQLLLNEASEESLLCKAREEQVDGREPQEERGPLRRET